MPSLRSHAPIPAVHISPAAVSKILAVLIALLIMASTIGQISTYYFGHGRLLGFVRLFALGEEGNVPTWYSSMTLLACAALLAVTALHARHRADRWWRHWAGLAVIFLWLSVDEAAQIHELTIEPLHDRLGVGSFLRWAWVVPGMLLVAVLGIVYLRFVIALPRPTRRLVVIAGAVFFAGGLGVEMISGWWFERYGNENFGFAMLWTAEEGLEMTGVAVFLYALLRHLADDAVSMPLRFAESEARREPRPAASVRV